MAFIQGVSAKYFRALKVLGADAVEISSAQVSMSSRDKCELVRMASGEGLLAIPEAGQKDNEEWTRSQSHVVQQIEAFQKAGAWKILFQDEGVSRDFKNLKSEFILNIVSKFDVQDFLFQLKNTDSQAWFVGTFGNEVNLDVDYHQVLEVELMRRGIRKRGLFGLLGSLPRPRCRARRCGGTRVFESAYCMRNPGMKARMLFTAGLAALALNPAADAADGAWKPGSATEIVVSQGAGGGTDQVARIMQKILADQRLTEVPTTVVNRPGGGGAIGLEYIAKRPPDGHTIAIGNATLLSSHLLGIARLGHADVTPFAFLAQDYVGFAVKADSPLRTAKDLLERLQRDPQSISFGIGAAVGNQNHIALALAARSVGVDVRKLKTVIFKSGGETETAILGGHIDVAMTSTGNFVRHVQSGALRLIAVAAPRRFGGELAGVPTWREHGADSVAGNWYVAYGPKGVGAAQVRYWEGALSAVVKTPEWKNFLASKHMSDEYLNTERTRAFLDEENAKLKRVLTELTLIK